MNPYINEYIKKLVRFIKISKLFHHSRRSLFFGMQLGAVEDI